MSALAAVLALAAFVAGVTGSWSPCGFSMVATIGPGGHEGGRRRTLAALATFAPGALLGGVLTFGGLALAGSALGGGAAALAVAAVVAGAGALLELAGVPIAPQVRRQVPERWRRVLPLPLAAGLYGVLLGLGFTTFVLTFAVPALAAIALAVGDLGTGVVVGLAFGLGRALPIALIAPWADRPFGSRATELMAEHPALLRGFRAADALALALVAVVVGTASAEAAAPRTVGAPGADPSADGARVLFHAGGIPVLAPAEQVPLQSATRGAVGGGRTALLIGGEVRVSQRGESDQLTFPAPGAEHLAVSAQWLVWKTGATITAVPLRAGATPRVVARGSALGRPALDGARLVFHVAGRRSSRIAQLALPGGRRRTLRSARRAQLTNPSVLGSRLLYVETSPRAQRLRLGRARPGSGRRDRTLLRIAPAIRADRGVEPGGDAHGTTSPARPPRPQPAGVTTTLWTTALAPGAAYVTRLTARDGRTDAELLRVDR